MNIDERYLSRKFGLTAVSLLGSVPLARWLTVEQWDNWALFVIQLLGLYFLGNVATKVVGNVSSSAQVQGKPV